jgi:diadenosine tetraphosphate (Ap4A) HIT family hydrolase
MTCPMCRRWEDDADLRLSESEHTFAVLNRDQFFPGYTLVFSKDHVTELFHLDPARRQGIMEDVCRVAAALDAVYRPTKMNYELLGNMVPHLHWHLVPRFAGDPLWPRPIWSEPHAEQLLEPADYRQAIARIRQALAH